jgi:putative hydrolase of the HAD superfamily
MVRAVLEGVRAIVFDAVGTLIHPEPSAAQVYAQVGRRFGSRLTAPEIAPRFAAAFEAEEAWDGAQGWRTSETREIQRWQSIVAWVLDDVSDPERCFQELFEHFSRPEAWRTDQDAAATIELLTSRGYMLGLASNYDHRLRLVAAGLPALRTIPHLVLSSEVGWRKPALPFFTALRQALGRPAEEILHVGDNRTNDYDGARAAGMHALLLDPRGSAGSSAVLRIRGLKELITWTS